MRMPTSTLSDYMIPIFKDRHSVMDSHQAILPDVFGLMQIYSRQICAGAEDREANPGAMDGFEITIHGTGYPLPGGYDELARNPTK